MPSDQPPKRDSLLLPLLETNVTSTNGYVTSSNSNNAAVAPPTLTTPTLTPTTLRNIEQMFMDSDSVVADECRPPDPHANAARFEPPQVNLSEVIIPTIIENSIPPQMLSNTSNTIIANEHQTLEVASNSISQPEISIKEEIQSSEQPIVFGPISNKIDDGSLALPGPHSNQEHQVQLENQQLLKKNITKNLLPSEASQKGKRKKNSNSVSSSSSQPAEGASVDLSLLSEEEKKKVLRRQRNKEAAARCRKRRLDQTLSLQDEVDRLEEKKSEMSQEIQSLENQKQELEKILKLHQCEKNKRKCAS